MPESHFPQLVRDLMTVGVLTCTPQTTVSELAQLFLEQCLDEIIVLDEGKIQAVDTHSNLLVKNPLYRAIYEAQTYHPGRSGEVYAR